VSLKKAWPTGGEDDAAGGEQAPAQKVAAGHRARQVVSSKLGEPITLVGIEDLHGG
jgi:hypothetical protein